MTTRPLALIVGAVAFLLATPASAQVITLPSEVPAQLKPTNYGFAYARREVMIPMRDGVKLHTVILVPNGAKRAPILLTRTPYNAPVGYDNGMTWPDWLADDQREASGRTDVLSFTSDVLCRLTAGGSGDQDALTP